MKFGLGATLAYFLLLSPLSVAAQENSQLDLESFHLAAVAEGVYRNQLSSCSLHPAVSSYAQLLMERSAKALAITYQQPRSKLDDIVSRAQQAAASDRATEPTKDWCTERLNNCLLSTLLQRDAAVSRLIGQSTTAPPPEWPKDSISCKDDDTKAEAADSATGTTK